MCRSRETQALGNVLGGVIDKMGLRPKINAARIVETWAIMAGPQINNVTSNVWFRHGRLFVQLTSAAWRHELHMQRYTWQQRLNDQLGDVLVDEIVFR